jgi:uncharacterized membrane protein YhaH (DUF805 family)/glutaredoxin
VNPVFNVVFFGETVPGYDRAAARRQLQALLKCSPEALDQVFSGQRVGLRKGLEAEDARRYQLGLKGIGLIVVIEPAPAIVPDETVSCPKCGERQPRRTLCRACATDMPRFQAALDAAVRETRKAPAEGMQALTYAQDAFAEPGSRLLGFDFKGRLGRQAYFLGATLGFSVLLLACLLFVKTQSLILGGIGLLLFIVYSTRLSALRCHDLGRSGWWSLATGIPYLGAVAGMVLTLMPGQKDDNDWGAKPRSLGWPAFAGGVALVIASTAGFATLSADLYRLPAMARQVRSSTPEAAFKARYDASRDRILMYSLSTCGYCTEKRRLFDRMGVRYTEYMIDEDQAAEDRLNSRMRQAGLPMDAVGTPIIEVNGTLLPNNPDLDEIATHLTRASKG